MSDNSEKQAGLLPVKKDGRHGSMRTESTLLTTFSMLLFIVLSLLILYPLLAAFLASFRPGQELMRYGLNLNPDPRGLSLDNYIYLFTQKAMKDGSWTRIPHSYFMWYKNSLFLTIISVCLQLFFCYLVAYGLSMYDFKLRNPLFFIVIATMMVPGVILMLPLYQEMIGLRLINTTAGVILPGICGAGTIFFFRQFMIGLPHELLDAGRIDGANEYRICFTIMLPLTKPAFGAMAILSAMGTWNDMLWPMLVYRNPSKFTLPIGLNTLMTPYGNNYDLLIAGSCFSVIPLLVVFFAFQRYFIGGMTVGAVKG